MYDQAETRNPIPELTYADMPLMGNDRSPKPQPLHPDAFTRNPEPETRNPEITQVDVEMILDLRAFDEVRAQEIESSLPAAEQESSCWYLVRGGMGGDRRVPD